MKITDVDVWAVVVPTVKGRTNSPEFGEVTWPRLPIHMIRLRTDDGVYGIGETPRGCPRSAVDDAAERLVDLDPMELCLQDLPLTDVSERQRRLGRDQEVHHGPLGARHSGREYVAFEMAVFDLVGRALGVPCHWLLGGAVRERVLVDYWIGQQNPEDAARNAKIGKERGFRGIKMKCAIDDPWEERIQAILDAAGPDFKVNIDPNERFYRPAEAIALARRLQRFPNIGIYESPVPHGNLDWYRQIRAAVDVPLAMHLGSPQAIMNALKVEACDYFKTGGGMVGLLRNAAIIGAAGAQCWTGAGVALGVREHALLHAAAAAQSCARPNDLNGSWGREDDLIVEGLQFEDGYAIVPDRPGLGCELDMGAIERYGVDAD